MRDYGQLGYARAQAPFGLAFLQALLALPHYYYSARNRQCNDAQTLVYSFQKVISRPRWIA